MRNLAVASLLGWLLVLSSVPSAAHEAQSYFDAGVQAFTQGKLAEAQEQLSKAIASYPEYVQAHYMLGHVAYQQNDYERALQAFRRALSSYPGYAEAHYMLGL